MKEIRFGLRRYPWLCMFIGSAGVGLVIGGLNVQKPVFMFPIGQIDAETARIALPMIGALTLLYLATLSYVRFVKRPMIRVGKREVTLPLGEFGQREIRLQAGDVLEVVELPKRLGGWLSCQIRHPQGVVLVHSSQVPDDESFYLVIKSLRKLIREA